MWDLIHSVLLVIMHNPLDFFSVLSSAAVIPVYSGMELLSFGGSKKGKSQESVFTIPYLNLFWDMSFGPPGP